MKFFEGMEHVETVKIHYPSCTCVKTSVRQWTVKKNTYGNLAGRQQAYNI